jgi:hypothetical protein
MKSPWPDSFPNVSPAIQQTINRPYIQNNINKQHKLQLDLSIVRNIKVLKLHAAIFNGKLPASWHQRVDYRQDVPRSSKAQSVKLIGSKIMQAGCADAKFLLRRPMGVGMADRAYARVADEQQIVLG